MKTTPRITPKNGAVFNPGQVIRMEFPAQGYVSPINTTFEFDVELISNYTTGNTGARFQNNIQSIFNRVRLLYGSTPIEDLIQYNQIVRNLTEWTSTNQTNSMDQTSIAEGIGGCIPAMLKAAADTTSVGPFGLVNVRENFIQGYNYSTNTNNTAFTGGSGNGLVPNDVGAISTISSLRRYQVNLALGLLTQDKLIPTKFMASQLAIEITLDQPAACIISQIGLTNTASPTYAVYNVNLIPEILEFDSSYDAGFLMGLQDSGVPIKFRFDSILCI